jgi:hypothetical protein
VLHTLNGKIIREARESAMNRSLVVACLISALLPARHAAANPVPCCQLWPTPSATELALRFTIHRSCFHDVGPSIDPDAVLVFKDGVQVTPFVWTVSSDASHITFSGSLPFSSADPRHTFKVSTSAMGGTCEGQVTFGIADVGADVRAWDRSLGGDAKVASAGCSFAGDKAVGTDGAFAALVVVLLGWVCRRSE